MPMPPRRQTANNFFLGPRRRSNMSPFIPRRNFEQPSAINGISRLINETQQTINVIQQLTPLLDQFRRLSPIISNLPMLLKLMSSLDESSSSSSSTDTRSVERSEILEEDVEFEFEETHRNRTVEEKNEFIKREVARILKEIGIEDN